MHEGRTKLYWANDRYMQMWSNGHGARVVMTTTVDTSNDIINQVELSRCLNATPGALSREWAHGLDLLWIRNCSSCIRPYSVIEERCVRYTGQESHGMDDIVMNKEKQSDKVMQSWLSAWAATQSRVSIKAGHHARMKTHGVLMRAWCKSNTALNRNPWVFYDEILLVWLCPQEEQICQVEIHPLGVTTSRWNMHSLRFFSIPKLLPFYSAPPQTKLSIVTIYVSKDAVMCEF